MKAKMFVLFIIACSVAMVTVHAVYAADESDVNTRLEKVEKELSALKAQKESTPWFSRDTSDPGLTWNIYNGKITLYGLADVSLDYFNNGMGGGMRNGVMVNGNSGSKFAIASNLSYFGIRGTTPILDGNKLNAVFQFETEVAYTYTPGAAGADTGAQNNGIGSRNSYIGLSGYWGAIKIGKTDAPYKTTTAKMDPFDRTLGDYNSIIGNTGGDNRAEFDTRVPHALWYESPNFHGLNFAVLWSPGQNQGTDNNDYAYGQPDCTGGNTTTGPFDNGCTDGSFGDLYSAALSYKYGPLYLTTAYEYHKDVNRLGDEGNPGPGGSTSVTGVHNEWAWKIGATVNVDATNTVINALYERTRRDGAPAAFDERSRPEAYYVSVSQYFTKSHSDQIDFAWAHAGKTPGVPGGLQNCTTGTGNCAGPIDDHADLLAIGYRHNFSDKRTSVYLVAAEMLNANGAHYDLGASGHGFKIDDKDGANNQISGTHPRSISMGMSYKF